MKQWQKIFLWILFAIHVFTIYACIDGYYDTIITNCIDWGPGGNCPWGSEAMGIAWKDPYSYVYFVSLDFTESLIVIIFATLALRKGNERFAILLLALPFITGFCANMLEMLLTI